MAGRSSVTIEPKYRFTGKEMSEATGHYLFGARTYNPLIGKRDQVDPLDAKYPFMSPYNYCLNNTIRLIDPNGEGVFINGSDAELVTGELSSKYGVEFRRDKETGLLSAYDSHGRAITSADDYEGALKELLTAMFSTTVEAELVSTSSNSVMGGKLVVGACEGSQSLEWNNHKLGVSWSRNYFNLEHAKKAYEFFENSLGYSEASPPGLTATHEIIEAFTIGKNSPDYKFDFNNQKPFLEAHENAVSKTWYSNNIKILEYGDHRGLIDTSTGRYFFLY